MNGTGITEEDRKWIDALVDSHKLFRSEVTKARVKILMRVAMTYKLQKIELGQDK